VALSAEIQDGWHVYGLGQLPGGPTPLRVTIDENEIVQATGNVTGSAPQKKHDPSFDLETQLYTHSFALQVPTEVKPHTANGKQLIPVNVHFQACSERICLPPRTVHLSVPIEISDGK
jgi:DsbC/DsbD-like thiol-disulfide interchange protein